MTPGRLSKMYSAMVINKARARLDRIEEAMIPNVKDSERDRFMTSLYQQMGQKYSKGRMISEDELKGIFSP